MDMGRNRMLGTLIIMSVLLLMGAVARTLHAAEVVKDSLFSFNYSPLTTSDDARLTSGESINRKRLNSASDNPHWDNTKCSICHVSQPYSLLTKMDSSGHEALCLDCHSDDITHVYIHPIDINLPESRKTLIASAWANQLRLDENNKLTCLTCHDLLDQCLPERLHQAKRNPRFLRGGPYSERYSMCYRCHDPDQYVRTNPHDQINDNGFLNTKMCRLCHQVDVETDLKIGVEKDLDNFPLLEGMNEDRTSLCIRCHEKIDHPSSAFRVHSDKKFRHLGIISGDKKETLQIQNNETGITLPLEPSTERIYCGTCHQPHQPGVFKGDETGPAKMKFNRLRSKPICKHCHAIYGSLMDDGTTQ